MTNWTQQKCHDCSGHGLISDYSYDGHEFEGPAECRTCNGTGTIWRSPKGSLAQYPGGRFVGKEPSHETF